MKLVDTNNYLLVSLNGFLILVGTLLNFPLDKSHFDCFEHAAHVVNPLDVFRGLFFNLVGEGFHVPASAHGVHYVPDPVFEGQYLLGAKGGTDRFFGGQCHCFIHGVSVQRLSTTQRRCHRLHRDPDNVVFRLLGGESGAGSLGMETEHHGLGIGGLEPVFHDFCPHAPRRAEFGDFFEKIIVSIEEETQSRAKFIHIQSGVQCRLHIGNTVRQCKCHFLHRR